MMMSIPTTTQVDDESMMLLSSLGSGISNQHNTVHHGSGQQNTSKVKKRRKRCRREGEEAKKRKLSDEQVKFLEMSFVREKKLESGRKVHLASEIGLDPKQVAVWFQNRRARWKSKQLEGEYMKLKSEHEAAIVEKFHLQAEILKLQDQLSKAQMKVTKLSGGYGDAGDQIGGGETSSSPCTSLSVDTTHCQSIFKDEEFDCINEYNYMNMLDWMDFYGM